MRIPAQIIIAVFAFACVASAQNGAPAPGPLSCRFKTRQSGRPRSRLNEGLSYASAMQ